MINLLSLFCACAEAQSCRKRANWIDARGA